MEQILIHVDKVMRTYVWMIMQTKVPRHPTRDEMTQHSGREKLSVLQRAVTASTIGAVG